MLGAMIAGATSCAVATEDDATSGLEVEATQSALVEDVVIELFGSKRDHSDWFGELFISLGRIGPNDRPNGAVIQYDARTSRYYTEASTLQVFCGVKGRLDIPAIVHYDVYDCRALVKGFHTEPGTICEPGFEVLYAKAVVDLFEGGGVPNPLSCPGS